MAKRKTKLTDRILRALRQHGCPDNVIEACAVSIREEVLAWHGEGATRGSGKGTPFHIREMNREARKLVGL